MIRLAEVAQARAGLPVEIRKAEGAADEVEQQPADDGRVFDELDLLGRLGPGQDGQGLADKARSERDGSQHKAASST